MSEQKLKFHLLPNLWRTDDERLLRGRLEASSGKK